LARREIVLWPSAKILKLPSSTEDLEGIEVSVEHEGAEDVYELGVGGVQLELHLPLRELITGFHDGVRLPIRCVGLYVQRLVIVGSLVFLVALMQLGHSYIFASRQGVESQHRELLGARFFFATDTINFPGGDLFWVRMGTRGLSGWRMAARGYRAGLVNINTEYDRYVVYFQLWY
jgi:hypothetical protein